ncbi:MAG: pirin family protein [Pseudomonadota bacterium]|nr:pirin family protein [Pseudomonadota bacterium]
MIEIRRSADRGHARHGWLDSRHSFSFADYHDPEHMGFGPLRVINEDRVEPGMGFGTHGHRDMEIISYVLEGEIEHRDSMGNGSVIVPGDVQRMSAGRGVQHSEYNPSRDKAAHFLQIWIEPSVRGVAPGYEQQHVSQQEKRNTLRLIASPEGGAGVVRIHQDARVYATVLDGDEAVSHELGTARSAYVHVVVGTSHVNGVRLEAGDAVKIHDEAVVRIDRADAAELLLFDLPRSDKGQGR